MIYPENLMLKFKLFLTIPYNCLDNKMLKLFVTFTYNNDPESPYPCKQTPLCSMQFHKI